VGDIFGSIDPDIVAYIGLKGSEQFNADLSRAGGGFGSFTSIVGKGALALGAVTAAMKLVGDSIGVAAELEKGMANVNTILKLTPPELENIKDELIGISLETPQGIDVLAKGLYDLASSGVAAADAQYALKQASMAATAGVTTVDTAVRAGMAVINAYGMNVKDLSSVYDLQFKTVEKGVLTYEEYARAIGNVLPSAASLGVSFEDLSAAIAQITLAGIDAQSATTYLARAFDEMVGKKNKWADLGVAIFDASGEFRGMDAVIGDLSRQMTGLTTEQQKMKLETLEMREQGQKAILALINNYGSFKNVIDETKKSHDAMAEAFGVQMNTFDAQAKLFKTELNVALEGLGSKILPILTVSLREVNEAAREWTAIDWAKNAVGGAYWDAYIDNAKRFLGLINYIDTKKAQSAIDGINTSTRDYADAIAYLNKNIGQVGETPIIPDAVVSNFDKASSSARNMASGVNELRINLDNFRLAIPEVTGPITELQGEIGEASGTGLSAAMRGLRSQAVLVTEPMKQVGKEAEDAGKKAAGSKRDWADYASLINSLVDDLGVGDKAFKGMMSTLLAIPSGAFDPITAGLGLVGSVIDAMKTSDRIIVDDWGDVVDILGKAGEKMREFNDSVQELNSSLQLNVVDQMNAKLESVAFQLAQAMEDWEQAQANGGAKEVLAKQKVEALRKEYAALAQTLGEYTQTFALETKYEDTTAELDLLTQKYTELTAKFGDTANLEGLQGLFGDTIENSEKLLRTLDPNSAAFAELNEKIAEARALLQGLVVDINSVNDTPVDIPIVMNPTGPVSDIKEFADGGYVPNTGLALLHANEFVLTKEATASLGPMRLERLNFTGDLSGLVGARASGQTVVNIIAGNTTPETWFRVSDKHIQPRIDQRTRKFQVQANPYAE